MDKQKVILLFFFSIIILFWFYYNPSSQASKKDAILINTWNDFPNASDVNAYPYQILQAYDVLKSQGYEDDNIYLFLYHLNNNINTNGVVIDYENENIKNSTFLNIIRSLSNEISYNDSVLIYIVAHGNRCGYNTMITFENNDSIKQDVLIKNIKLLNCNKIIILLDFCYSGNFISSLKASNKLIITASDGSHQAWNYWDWTNLTGEDKTIYGDSGSAFFHPFWYSLKYNGDYVTAFNYGKEKCIEWGEIDIKGKNMTYYQNPQLFIGSELVK